MFIVYEKTNVIFIKKTVSKKTISDIFEEILVNFNIWLNNFYMFLKTYVFKFFSDTRLFGLLKVKKKF